MKGLKIALVVMLSLLLMVVAVIYATIQRMPPVAASHFGLQKDPVTADQPASSPSEDVALPALSNAKIGWGIGPSLNEIGQPLDCINAQKRYEQYGGQFIFPDDENVIYLTFDLGYENGYTEPILDAMKARGVKGTFFITMDYAIDAPEIVRRIIAEGHTLANHTAKHPSMPGVDDARAKTEIMELHNYVQNEFGYTMTLFRYPMGEFSEHSLALVQSLGYQSIFWSFAYVDWKTDAQPSTSTAMSKMVGSLHAGAIYLLHAVSSTNAAVMGAFLDQAAGKGYSFGLVDVRLGLVDSPEEKAPSILD